MPGGRMRKKSNTRRINSLPQQPSMASSSPFLLHYRKISVLVFLILVVCLVVFLNTSSTKEGGFQYDVPSNQLYTVEVVNEFPHDPGAFTQGLLYAENDTLFESTGMNGASSVRKVTLQTGEVKAIQKMQYSDFGEGLTLLGDRLIQVTWRQSTGYIYDRHNLSKFEKFSHGMPDGWGLATDGKVLFGSDGSSTLYQIDPQTMKVVKKKFVNYQGDEVHRLNELEYVYDEVWANVWMTDCIARISHKDGSVLGWILLHNLREGLLHNLKQIDVLNGIAWDRDGDRLFVTGKWWPKLYEIKLHPLKTPFNGDIKQICMPPAFPFS
ncbi:glutaminyl-peptide cyclotransferase [Nicotiana tabacum]|uniref:Glutaminyl-peptide cyclotransferase n=1 Tax=Nicotiana tabacum TaxID=4097 RepID=A0A1S4DMP3_TOBAC|nr:glutaminyl-peptide cyclotransferase-like [Nicotiana tomentosiformis]XP_016514429.1 PREDICTED: glutaminyl-peptide cyclotransferase-like [Nicotiana tabacum]